MMSRLKSRFVKVTKQFWKSFCESLPFFLILFPFAGSCFACRCTRWSSAFYIILISPDSCVSRRRRSHFAATGYLCLNGVGHLFPARTNKGIDYVGYRGSRVVLNGRRFTRGMLARTGSDNSGVDALNVCRLPEAWYFAGASRSRDK